LFGFQYHIEATPQIIEAMLDVGKADLHKAFGPGGETKIMEDTKTYYPRYERLTNRMLGNFVQFLRVY
jgi:hypothetical protein